MTAVVLIIRSATGTVANVVTVLSFRVCVHGVGACTSRQQVSQSFLKRASEWENIHGACSFVGDRLMRGTSTFEGIGVQVWLSITTSWEVVILDCIWTLTRLDVIVKSIPQRDRKFVCVTSRSCEKYGIIREYEDETGESQPDARSTEGCDSPCRIRVRALWLHFWHAQIQGQSATIYVNRNFSWNHGLVQL